MGGAPQQFMMSWDVVICCVQMGPSPPSHDMHRFEKVSGGVFLSPFTYIHLAQWPVLTSWKYIALLQNDITLVAITFKLLSIAIRCFWIWCGTTNFPWPWIQSWLNLDACYPLSRKSQQRFENRFICFKAVEWLVGFWWFDYMSSCCRHPDMGWYLDDVLSARRKVNVMRFDVELRPDLYVGLHCTHGVNDSIRIDIDSLQWWIFQFVSMMRACATPFERGVHCSLSRHTSFFRNFAANWVESNWFSGRRVPDDPTWYTSLERCPSLTCNHGNDGIFCNGKPGDNQRVPTNQTESRLLDVLLRDAFGYFDTYTESAESIKHLLTIWPFFRKLWGRVMSTEEV